MKFTEHTKRALEHRRFEKKMYDQGYWFISEPVWEIKRGLTLYNERIVDVKITPDGKDLWVKVSNAPKYRY